MHPFALCLLTLEERERLARVEARAFDHRRDMIEAERDARAEAASGTRSVGPAGIGAMARRIFASWRCPDGATMAD